MPGAKLTKIQRQEITFQVSKLARRGYSSYSIAKVLNLSQSTIAYYLKRIHQQYVKDTVEQREALVMEKLHQLRDIRIEAWEEWERSKLDSHRMVEELILPFKKKREEKEEAENGEGDLGPMDGDITTEGEDVLKKVKQIMTTEGRLADAAFLKIILDTLKAERELLGLDAPKKLDLNSQVHQFNWELLTSPPAELDNTSNKINQRIQDILSNGNGSSSTGNQSSPPQLSGPEQLPSDQLQNGLIELPPSESNGDHSNGVNGSNGQHE